MRNLCVSGSAYFWLVCSDTIFIVLLIGLRNYGLITVLQNMMGPWSTGWPSDRQMIYGHSLAFNYVNAETQYVTVTL